MNRPRDARDPSRHPDPWHQPSRASLIDRQIREAQEAGKFDDLPFQGERIPLEDDSAAGDWAVAHHILRNAHMVPPWIATDREVRDLLARRDEILARAPRSRGSALGRERDRGELTRVVEAATRAIAILNNEAPADRQQRRPLDLAAELASLASVHSGEDRRPEPARPGSGPWPARLRSTLLAARSAGAIRRRSSRPTATRTPP